MDFRMLGPLEVWDGERQLKLEGPKRRAVLAFLLLHANEVVAVDRLVDQLWGVKTPRNATAAVHTHVSRLRKELGPDVIASRAWGYVLRTEPDALDLDRFERLIADAESLPARERAQKLREALALWRGPPLEDLAFEPALSGDIARLEELHLTVVENRIDADLEAGNHNGLIGELEALIAEQPLRERLRGQLILALYRGGRQAEALEVYRETRRMLAEQLGLEPSPALRELEQAVLRQDPALASAPPQKPKVEEEIPPDRWRWPRSPLVIGAGLLLLGGAGVAAALLVPAGAGSHNVIGPPLETNGALPSFPLPTLERRVTTTIEQPHISTESHVTSTSEQTTAVVVTQPATTQHLRPQPKPPAAKWVYVLSDDFGDPAFNFSMWHVAGRGTGADYAEQNGRLEFSIADDVALDPQWGLDQHYETNCLVTGDFDVTVDFELLTWPSQDGLRMTLGAWFPSPHENWLAVERFGGQADGMPEGYGSNLGTWAQTKDNRGALRLSRHGGTLAGYYRYRKTWVELGARHAPGPATLVIDFNTAGIPAYGGKAATGAFDNFQATAESVDCHGLPLPPRKRRA